MHQVPGEKEARIAENQRKKGIVVHEKIAETLTALGERLGVPVPAVLRGDESGKEK